MAARKPTNNPRRDDPKPRSSGKGGGLLTGLFIGLVIGLIVAAGLVWYFNNRTPAFESVESASSEQDKADEKPARETAAKTPEPPAEASVPEKPESNPATNPGTSQDRTQTGDAAPGIAAPDTAPNSAKPRVDYTFYGILPGDKPAKPVPPPISKDVWWLQVAALKNPADADKLKARLSLLGLQVAMQKVDSGGVALYRIRTGPYQREDDALGDLDTLAANNFEPRLFKEPNIPAAPSNPKEKP